MGNFFSGHFTYYRPPLQRRSSRHRMTSRPMTNSSTVNGLQHHQPMHPSAYQRSASASSFSEPSQDFSSTSGTMNSQAQLLKRKPSVKMALKKAYANATVSGNVFTDEKRQLVQNSWKDIAIKYGKLQTSVKIFKRMFFVSPAIRTMFEMPENEFHLDDCPEFIRHAQVFVNILDLAVRNVFELEAEVGPVLTMVGRRHFQKERVPQLLTELSCVTGPCQSRVYEV